MPFLDSMKTKLLLFFCLVIVFTVTGCRSRSPKVVTVPLPDVSGDAVKLQRSLSATGVPVNMDFDHPHDFSQQEMRNEIGLLVVRQYEWGKFGEKSKWIPGPVFPEAAQDQLVAAFVTAFKEASRSDRVIFDVPGKDGLSTRGRVYVEKGKLIWIFETVDGISHVGRDPFKLDGKDWTIEEKAGMDVTRDQRNKIVKVERDLAKKPPEPAEVARETVYRPAEPAAAAPREAPEEAVSSSMDRLDKKLETLKEWKDEGLITDEEYAKEKARIIEELHGL
jgi:hypothetical protein